MFLYFFYKRFASKLCQRYIFINSLLTFTSLLLFNIFLLLVRLTQIFQLYAINNNSIQEKV